MKKAIVALLAVAFVATAAMSAFGRTIEEEKQAVRDYLKVVDAKIVKFRESGQTSKMRRMQAEKQATLRRWEALKAQMEAAPAPAPAPAPVAPAPVAPAPAPTPAPVSSQGMGITIGGNVGLDAGLTGAAGNLDYDLTSMGLAGAKVRLGGNYISGTNPTGNDSMKAVSLKIGALYNVSDYLQMLGLPLTYYVGAAYLIPVKVNNSRTGKWGAEAYIGADYMIPSMGMINGELGYAGLKYADNQAALKGIDLKIGYRMMF